MDYLSCGYLHESYEHTFNSWNDYLGLSTLVTKGSSPAQDGIPPASPDAPSICEALRATLGLDPPPSPRCAGAAPGPALPGRPSPGERRRAPPSPRASPLTLAVGSFHRGADSDSLGSSCYSESPPHSSPRDEFDMDGSGGCGAGAGNGGADDLSPGFMAELEERFSVLSLFSGARTPGVPGVDVDAWFGDVDADAFSPLFFDVERRSRKLRGKAGEPPRVCVFCRNNGEVEAVYAAHVLKAPDGRVLCPRLRAYTCPLCGVSGDRAHTIKYCPLSREPPPRKPRPSAGPAPPAARRRIM